MIDWGKAIGNLEQANEAVLGCAPADLTGLEAAMARRDTAVQLISSLDPWDLPGPLASRLRAAFDAGSAVRAKLAAIYRDADHELRRSNCVRRFFENSPR